MNSQVKKAYDNHVTTAGELLGVIKQTYPIGRVLWVELGGNRLTIEVTGYGWNYMARPGEILGTNMNTGKRRTFYPEQIEG